LFPLGHEGNAARVAMALPFLVRDDEETVDHGVDLLRHFELAEMA
jgi:hypothetical protein